VGYAQITVTIMVITYLFTAAHLFEFWLGGTLAPISRMWRRTFLLPNPSWAALKRISATETH